MPKFAIYDTRPKHSHSPYLFTDCENHEDVPAIFSSEEEAEAMCQKMNSSTALTTYAVKEIYAPFAPTITNKK